MAEHLHGFQSIGCFTNYFTLKSSPSNKTLQPLFDNRLIINDHDVIHAMVPPDQQVCEG
ncbi:hypothetical protein D3C75_1177460 [compost metagenome]